MRPLLKIILRWGIIEIIAVHAIDALFGQAATYPTSWIVYSLAGREAAGRGKTWHGLLAGAGVPVLENLAWFAQGAPGHADTSDLPWFIAALTYIALVMGMILIGVAFGAIGAVFGRLARRSREEAMDRAAEQSQSAEANRKRI